MLFWSTGSFAKARQIGLAVTISMSRVARFNPWVGGFFLLFFELISLGCFRVDLAFKSKKPAQKLIYAGFLLGRDLIKLVESGSQPCSVLGATWERYRGRTIPYRTLDHGTWRLPWP